MMTATQPEIDLLLCCARTSLDSNLKERIRLLLKQNIDWTYLIKIAFQHNLIPLLYQNLKNTYPEEIPEKILTQLQSYSQGNTIRNLSLTKELITLLKVFEEREIKTIPFKGPILASSVYNNLALRQFCDLDILVDQAEIEKAKEILISQGYQPDSQYNWEQTFIHKDKKISVDLHWGITPQYFPFILDFDQLWQGVTPLSIAGTTQISFSSEDLLVILCLQIAKDAWENRLQLLKVCDLSELLNHLESINWQIQMDKADEYNIERLILLGFALVRDLFGKTLPLEIAKKIERDTVVKLYSQFIQKQLLFPKDQDSILTAKGKFQVFLERLIIEKPTYRNPFLNSLIWQSFRLLVTPNTEDRTVFPLPSYFEFLYYVIRPIRLGYSSFRQFFVKKIVMIPNPFKWS